MIAVIPHRPRLINHPVEATMGFIQRRLGYQLTTRTCVVPMRLNQVLRQGTPAGKVEGALEALDIHFGSEVALQGLALVPVLDVGKHLVHPVGAEVAGITGELEECLGSSRLRVEIRHVFCQLTFGGRLERAQFARDFSLAADCITLDVGGLTMLSQCALVIGSEGTKVAVQAYINLVGVFQVQVQSEPGGDFRLAYVTGMNVVGQHVPDEIRPKEDRPQG